MSERIWEKDYGPFRVFGYVAPEEMDVEEIFENDADNVDEIRADIRMGDKVWVYATARVFCKGVELGDASIGGLLYKDYDGIKKEIFDEDTHDIVHDALKIARASLNYLKDVKAPPREQLTSQFMEGQVY
tara:strand:+ start:1245 stop:1634 length:390 start_codon:yes stop_codon:yes gene_type:complete